MIELGDRYQDPISGYTGTATARTEFLHETVSVRLTRGDANGKPEHEWFPEPRLADALKTEGPGFA
jgi:hypothetical protein